MIGPGARRGPEIFDNNKKNYKGTKSHLGCVPTTKTIMFLLQPKKQTKTLATKPKQTRPQTDFLRLVSSKLVLRAPPSVLDGRFDQLFEKPSQKDNTGLVGNDNHLRLTVIFFFCSHSLLTVLLTCT